ncbi:fatty-acyl coenzyme A oxidase [Dissophora ornata]|nr:fatty-acyl coenzyme A oxidase [Dissophora ornata]
MRGKWNANLQSPIESNTNPPIASAPIETEAEFIASKVGGEESCVTAAKRWIGGAAHTVTHCVVIAQLIVRRKRYGTKSCNIQLRDTDTYNLRPGINIGDIGDKMDSDGFDCGWIQSTNVRIPHTNMLMKHTKISRASEVK